MVMPSGFSSTYTGKRSPTPRTGIYICTFDYKTKEQGEVKEKRWQKVFLRGVCSGKGDTSHLLQPREKKKPNPCASQDQPKKGDGVVGGESLKWSESIQQEEKNRQKKKRAPRSRTLALLSLSCQQPRVGSSSCCKWVPLESMMPRDLFHQQNAASLMEEPTPLYSC